MNTIILSIVLAGLFPTMATAQAPGRSETVRHDDLDLRSVAGTRMLDRRIRTAVKALCGSTSDADPAGKNKADRCRAEALRQAQLARHRVIEAQRNNLVEQSFAEQRRVESARATQLARRASSKPQ